MKRAILITLSILLMLTLAACSKKDDPVPPAADGSQSAITQGSMAATTYPDDMDTGKVGDILTTLGGFVEQVTADGFTTADLLSNAYGKTVLRFNITDGVSDAVKITKADQLDSLDRDPLSAARQEVLYAKNSGHTVNNLTVADKSAFAGLPDFTGCFSGDSYQVELTEVQAGEIIDYFATLMEGETNTELYLLSGDAMAFVMCERYSDTSLLGFAAIFQPDSKGNYRLQAIVDFNC